MAGDNDLQRERQKQALRERMVSNEHVKSAFSLWVEDHRRALLVIGGTLALTLAVTALIFLIGIRLWTHTSYGILWSRPVGAAEDALFLSHAGGVAVVGDDGVILYNAAGERAWNVPFSMSDPRCTKRGDYLLIYDARGQSFLICDGKGQVGAGTTSYPISGGQIAATGVVVLRLEDKTATLLQYYRSSGEELQVSVRSPLADAGYPLAFALSDNGQQLAVSYYAIDSLQNGCTVVFYDFEQGEAPGRRTGVFSHTEDGAFISQLSFSGNGAAYAVATDRLLFYDLTSRTDIKESEATLSGEVRQLFAGEGQFGLLLLEDGMAHIDVYTAQGKQKESIPQTEAFAHYFFQGNDIGMYNEEHCRLISLSGRLLFDLDMTNRVQAFLPGRRFGLAYLATMDQLQKITLR